MTEREWGGGLQRDIKDQSNLDNSFAKEDRLFVSKCGFG